jgi:hypothetical protein
MTRHLLRAGLALATLLAVVTTGAAPALAHAGDGIFELESRELDDTSATYVVRLTWEDDGHAAVDATVTATAIAPDGTQQTPVPMDEVGDGRYGATVRFPEAGTWTVRFTSVSPPGTLEVEEEVAAPATTTSTTSTTSTTEPEQVVAPATTLPDEDDGGGTSGWLAIAFVALLVVAGAVAAARARRSRDAA